jgi:hypothetical protein
VFTIRITQPLMIRSILLWLTGAVLVGISYWNIWTFDRSTADFPPRNSETEVVAQSARYEDIRNRLLALGYRTGTIGFITNRDLKSQQNTDEDGKRWSQAQFILVPWILLRGKRSVSGYEVKTDAPFVIGDFWDGTPAGFPPELVKLHESGDGLMLFRRKPPE